MVLVGQPISSGQLVKLCRPLGLTATNVKSHLTRLVAEGALLRTGSPRMHRYAISPQRGKLVEAISNRLQQVTDERWDGQWLMVALRSQANRTERERLRSGLWFDGFRPCGQDTFLRPAWPRAWAVARAQSLLSVSAACVMGPLLGTLQLDQVRRMYRLVVMDARARQLARRIETIGERVDDAQSAFKARLTVGGLAVDLVSHIPNLPLEIWGDLTGLPEAQSAYAAFERRMIERANVFVRAILSDKGGLMPHRLRTRRRRGSARRTGNPEAVSARSPIARRVRGGPAR
jgi:DNA-binding transcriptional regulator PaaX